MTSPLLKRPGAVEAGGVDAGVAAHYGDPFREQRTLAEGGPSAVDRSHRGVLTVTGADRLSWLHSLTSQHLEKLPPGRPTEALVLSPHGHVEHHLQLTDDGTTTWIHVEPGTAAALLGYLERMVFMLRVEPRDVTDDWAVLTIDGADVLVPRDGIEDAVGDRTLAGIDAYEALRVERRTPRLGFETDHRTIVQEPEWIPAAVHLDKGCYRGQETVARVQNLGRPPRRMVLIHLDGSTDQLPAVHTPITMDGRAIGFVGTAVRHHELGMVALALVKRSVPDDATLRVENANAAIDSSNP